MTTAKARQEDERAYVLHTYPFQDTSVVVEAFTRQHGRIGILAKGARRPKSPLRAALLAFQPLSIAWTGRGELPILVRADWVGRQHVLTGIAMMCGYYLNELLLKLVQRDDAHEGLFDAYDEALRGLAGTETSQAVLRRFEIALLRELGYALQLEYEADADTPIVAERRYAYFSERGPIPAETAGPGTSALELQGQTLLDMARGDFTDPRTAAESKVLMRWVIGHHLDQRPLNTRQLLIELQQL